MISLYLWLKWLHIISSTVLFGMGAGIAFFFLQAQRTGNAQLIAAFAKDVVLADALFTATAARVQPSTGIARALMGDLWWFGLGWPAFIGVLVIFYLMVAKLS